MAKDDRKKFRTDFRKHHEPRTRRSDWTREYQDPTDESSSTERISGKGDLTRKRTVFGSLTGEEQSGGLSVDLAVDEAECLRGRVLRVHGVTSIVCTEQGEQYRCATRRLLKSLTTEQRSVVAAGDRVWFRPAPQQEGIIERIEPRHGVLSRTSRGRRHVIAVNVDQLVIVTSAAEPYLKPNLIDRMLVTAEKVRIRPLVCINKIDLVEPADLQPLVGGYGQMGYQVLLLSALTGFGIAGLRQLLAGRESVVAGQSGVGKSSLLNAIEPGLDLKVRTVSEENQKGRHTTSTAPPDPAVAGRVHRRHAGHPPVPAVGRDPRGTGRFLPRPAALRQPVPVPQLHAHARGGLRHQGRRGRRPAGRAAVRELLPPADAGTWISLPWRWGTGLQKSILADGGSGSAKAIARPKLNSVGLTPCRATAPFPARGTGAAGHVQFVGHRGLGPHGQRVVLGQPEAFLAQEQRHVVPLLEELRFVQADVAADRVGQEHPAVDDAAEHHEVLEIVLDDPHDHRSFQLVGLLERDLGHGRLVPEIGRALLQVQHRQAVLDPVLDHLPGVGPARCRRAKIVSSTFCSVMGSRK